MASEILVIYPGSLDSVPEIPFVAVRRLVRMAVVCPVLFLTPRSWLRIADVFRSDLWLNVRI